MRKSKFLSVFLSLALVISCLIAALQIDAAAAENVKTLQGILICNDCVDDGYVIGHTAGCCLMDSCSLSGYGILVPQYNSKSYKYYRFDEQGSDKAHKLLLELQAANVVDYLSVQVTGAVENTPGTYTYQSGGNKLSVNYDGKISNLTELTYDETHKKYEENAVSLSDTDVKIEEIPDQIYSGKAIKPKLTVKDGSYTLIANEDYSTSYKANNSLGTATVVIKGTGAFYKGSLSASFNIVDKSETKKDETTKTDNAATNNKYNSPQGYTEEKTDWSYVTFGSYPQNEIQPTDKIINAVYDDNNDTVADGIKYHRISQSDVTNVGDYAWKDGEYRYFSYEPINWRVLNISNDELLLISDNVLDDKKYNSSSEEDVTWETSSLRTWLNENFFDSAFSEKEKAIIITSSVVNNVDNSQGINGGNDTQDKVYILSEDEITRNDYGFTSDTEYTSHSRIFSPTAYAIAEGVTVDDDTSGADYYWLRSSGVNHKTAAIGLWNGSVYAARRQTAVTNDVNGVIPVIRVKYDSDIIGGTPSNPVYTAESAANYDTVALGSYPQSVIKDVTDEIVNAEYDENGDTVVNGDKIKRLNVPIKIENAADKIKGLKYDENGFYFENGIEKYRKITETSGTESADYYYEYNYKYYKYEPIIWKVLSSDGNKLKLFSQNVLTAREFYPVEGEPVNWAASSLRIWLNEDFYNNAFTNAEKKAILTSTVETAGSESDEEISGGETVNDKVYLLSQQDVRNVSYGFNSDQSIVSPTRQLASTEYADDTGILTWAGYINQNEWWTRSMGYWNTNPVSVYDIGSVRTNGRYDIYALGVAPVIEVSADALPEEKTVQGVLICSNCATGGMGHLHGAPYSHTTQCCLMDGCIASGYGILVPNAETKSYKFYKFDLSGDKEAEQILRQLKEDDVKSYLTVNVTGIFDEEKGSHKYTFKETEYSYDYDGTITDISKIEYDESHSEFEKNAEDISKVVVAPVKEQAYTGSPIYLMPDEDIIITDGNYTLQNKLDYILSYENNTEIGTASVTITGVGAFYKGTTTTEFNIAESTKYIYGDVDGDGHIDSGDALLILRASVNLENFTDEQNKCADVDFDGKLTSADSLYVLRYSVGYRDNGVKIG